MCLLLNAVLMLLMVTATRVPLLAIATGFTAGLLLYAAIAALFCARAPGVRQRRTYARRGPGAGHGKAGGNCPSPTFAGVLLDLMASPDLFTFYASSQLLAALLIWRRRQPRREAG